MRFVKPLDRALILECAERAPHLVTVEDHVLQGGFGSAVLEVLEGREAQVMRLGLPDHFVEHGAPGLLYESAGLSGPKIAERIAQWAHIEAEALSKAE